jgi:small subunit ribosomal protein S18
MARKRAKPKDAARKAKRKVSILDQDRVRYVDYKDINLLRRFMSERAKIRARRVTGNSAQQQRAISMAIKNAREMALLPYATRVSTSRGGGRGRGDRDDREWRPPREERIEGVPAIVGAAAEAEAEGAEVPEILEDVDQVETGLPVIEATVAEDDSDTEEEEE